MHLRAVSMSLLFAIAATPAFAADKAGNPDLAHYLSYPYPSELAASPNGSGVAWVQNELGVRNVWMADATGGGARQLTRYTEDDGQEITHLAFSRDGQYLVFVRGGDHDANWPEPVEPDPAAKTTEPAMQIWCVHLKDAAMKLLGDGDAPAIAPDSTRVAFIHDHAVWAAPLDGTAKAALLFFDRGHASDLAWSPDGKALAFVSGRDDHSFISIWRDAGTPVQYLAPSTSHDFMPRWSPDGKRIAFVRMPGDGGAPQPILKQVPAPWAIWVAEVASGKGSLAWQSPDTLHGSYPDTAGEANLHWLAGDKLLFLADLDDWPHLYSVPAAGGKEQLLTPGKFMVEDVSVSGDGERIVYSANTGATNDDQDRRHLYMLTPDSDVKGTILTGGDTLEWTPQVGGDGKTLVFVQAGFATPPLVMTGSLDARNWRALDQERVPADFPSASFVTPKSISFTSEDGLEVHGQIFSRDDGSKPKPAVIFVHGGPPRQMLLGWHYMGYYSNAYAVNQYLANHGFVVLALNYRLGIGYGYDFMHPDHWGPTGAAEYKDVLAAGKLLLRDQRVDPRRIGIWGGSYGGFLTAMALAKNSNIFKAGVDLHGVHDWSYDLGDWFTGGKPRYEEGDRKQAMKVAWQSSPVAFIKTWRSPVLLIQGDDDRNVYFHEMIDLVNRLQDQHVTYEQLVLPNEIHGFLRHSSWLAADAATVEFLQRKLQGGGK